MARDIPEQWKPYTDAKGVRSFRGLAMKSGLSTATVIRLMTGEGEPDPATVEQVGEALGLTNDEVLALSGSARRDFGPLDWPEESRYLTPKQRDAVTAVIRSMVNPGESEEDGATVTPIREHAEVNRGVTAGKLSARTKRPPAD